MKCIVTASFILILTILISEGVREMPKKSSFPQFFTDYDFEKPYRLDSDARSKIRLLAMLHLQKGKSFTEIGNMLRVNRHTVAEWFRRFVSEGIHGLSDKLRSGRKPTLPPSEEDDFKKEVINLQKERKGGRVKGKEIRQMLKDRFGAEYSLSGVYDLLGRLGIVWITGRSSHPKADPEAQKDFKENFAEKAKEVLPEGIDHNKVDIWFQDETRVGQRGTTTRIWAEKGTRPGTVQQQQFQSVYIFGAVCPRNDEAAGLVMPKADTEVTEIHLRMISDMVQDGHHALVVLDGASWHTTPKLKCPENISLLPLPPYSPELNPTEQVWEQLRHNSLSNRCFETYEAIVDACCEAWNFFTGITGSIKSLCSRKWAFLAG
jgi:transposase